MKSSRSKIVAALAAVLIAGAAFMAGTSLAVPPNAVSAASVLYNQDTVTSIYDLASQGVVEIQTTQQGTGFYGGSMQEGQGSGFIIDNQGHILTNNHFVEGAAGIRVILNDSEAVAATVLGTDTVNDLAVISVAPSSVSQITPLQFGDSSSVKPGQMAIAMGSPLGLNDSITVGVISGLNRTVGNGVTSMLQTDASLNPGNYGGPLLNADGLVIGINTALETAPGTSAIGFAVPSNVAVRELSSLIAGEEIVRPWLGISGLSLTPSTASSLGLSLDQGIYVVTVALDSPASKAGLEGSTVDASGIPTAGGDVITSVDGNPVASVQELAIYLSNRQVGDNVNLSILRSSQSINISVTLEAWPNQISTNTPQTCATSTSRVVTL